MSPTFVFCLCVLIGVSGSETIQTKSTEVMEGDSFTLHTDITEIQDDDLILWTFGAKDTYIAKLNKAHNEIFHEGFNGRFRDRLRLDNQTGSLTVTNTCRENTGSYKVEIVTENKVSVETFSVTVYASLPVPVITSYPLSNPSSNFMCELMCSVMNVTHVTLSWYKGIGLLSSINISELNTTVSLHLEVDYQDNNIYSCVVNNPISDTTKHLKISDFCQPGKSSCIYFAHSFTEAVFRLVLSAIVGVATIALLIYEINSRSV